MVPSRLSSSRRSCCCLVGRLLGEVMQRIGQPSVIGQLIAGIVLGPSVFGTIWPDAQHAIFAGASLFLNGAGN